MAEQFDLAKAISRFDRMKADKVTPRMPPIGAPHLFQWLTEIGLTESSDSGLKPLSWREISAWVERTAVDLAPWEARLIRALSASYVAESRRAEDETAPPPYYTGEVSAAEVQREVNSLRGLLG